jgi:nicotinate-nucleotide adenylyltransferase
MQGGIGLFGGSFNPIHIGHLIVARSMLEQLGLRRMVLIPSANPPHKHGLTELADATDRLKMVRLAISGEAGFEADDIEIRRSGPSYTILTVQDYRKALGQRTGNEPAPVSAEPPLYWIIGGDSLPELHTWYRIRELVEQCRIVTAARPGYERPDLTPLQALLTVRQIQDLRDAVLPTPRIDISATDIRRRIREERSIRYLVPENVREYIESRRLYHSSQICS